MSMSPLARLTARQDRDQWTLAWLFDDGWRVNQIPRPTYLQSRMLRPMSPLRRIPKLRLRSLSPRN